VRVGVWGTFDVDNYGDHLFPRIAAMELGRRMAGAEVVAYSPFGGLHPTRLDDPQWPVAPLGPWSADRVSELAGELHAVLVGGGELIHLNDRMLAPVYGVDGDEMERMAPSRYFVEGLGPALEANCPVVWHGLGVSVEPTGEQAARLRDALAHRPYVTVRDEGSRARLERAGVADVAVVPDSALLLPRLLPPSSRRRRTVVIQGCDLLAPYADDVAAGLVPWFDRHPDHVPVLLETGRGRGDADFADAITPLLGRPSYRVPATASVEDIAAVIAEAAAFVGSSLHGSITALAYGRPFVVVDIAPEPKLEAFAALVGATCRLARTAGEIAVALDSPMPSLPLASLQARVDDHFDRVAALVSRERVPRARRGRGEGARGRRAWRFPTR
jgi:polysaccharide pyruvyl transferase WcaK-like protein